jgi:hypothetical protein
LVAKILILLPDVLGALAEHDGENFAAVRVFIRPVGLIGTENIIAGPKVFPGYTHSSFGDEDGMHGFVGVPGLHIAFGKLYFQVDSLEDRIVSEDFDLHSRWQGKKLPRGLLIPGDLTGINGPESFVGFSHFSSLADKRLLAVPSPSPPNPGERAWEEQIVSRIYLTK